MANNLADLTGIWRRESLTIEQGQPFEDSEVYWLQVDDYFADMRWPRQPLAATSSLQSAYAGRTQWSPPTMTFTHHIDLTQENPEDAGNLMMVNGQLWEQGQVTIDGKIIRYKEVWSPQHRIDQASKTTVAVVDTLEEVGYFVQVADFAIAMNNRHGAINAACLRQNRPGHWRILHRIGRIESLNALMPEHLVGLIQETD